MIQQLNDKELKDFAQKVERKISISYYKIPSKRGFLRQLGRAIVYLFRQKKTSYSASYKSRIDVSLPYFRADVISSLVPIDTVSIHEIDLSLFERVKTLAAFIFILKRLYKIKVDNKDLVASAMLVSYSYFQRIEKTKVRDIRFHYYSFVSDAYALIYLLSISKKHRVTYVEWSSFIDKTMEVKCDIYSSRFELVSDFAHKWEGVRAKEFRFRIPSSKLIFEEDESPKSFKTIAFYSGSFYARLEGSHMMHDVVVEAQRREDQILSLLKTVVLSDERLRLRVFYHSARGVDSACQAKEHYHQFIVPDKVMLMEDGHDALTDMNGVAIGFTVISNVFWDCLINGTRCFLFKPMFCDDLVSQSRLNNVCIDRLSDSADAVSIIRDVLSETSETYRLRLCGY